MSPKKLEIDNRDKKTPPVHRFMTPKAAPEPVAEIPASESEPLKYDPQPVKPADPSDGLVITEINVPSPAGKHKNIKPISTPETPEIDYRQFISSIQDQIDGITNSHIQAQEDIKAHIKESLKLELIEEIKNELKDEIRGEIAEQEKTERGRMEKEREEKEKLIRVEKADEPRYIFRNTMEDIVAEEVSGFLKNEKNMCKCSRCINDICAIALNMIPPHYVTSEVGHLYDRAGLLDITKLNNITATIIKALEQVKKNPAHPV